MKLILPILFLAMMFTASAQENHYSYSAFRDVQGQFASQAKRAASIEQWMHVFPGAYFHTDRLTGQVNDIYGKALTVQGNTVQEKARHCIGQMPGAAGISPGEWYLGKETATPKFQYVSYHQVINGHNVLFSKIGFTFTAGGRLARTIIRAYDKPKTAAAPLLSKEDVISSGIAAADIRDIRIKSAEVVNDWVWFPVPGKAAYDLHPAWEVKVNAAEVTGQPVKLLCYIDATNGKLLYRTNEIKNAFDVTVKGEVFTQNPLSPASLEPLENLMVIVNGNSYYTDLATGKLSISSLTGVTGNYSLSGRWVAVVDFSTGTIPAFDEPLSGTGNIFTFPATGISNSRVVNAYYHTNRIHDYMKGYLPAFTDLDQPIQANVDLNSDFCNAFFDGGSINFFAAGAGCNSYAEIGDVVYHEYGHAINAMFYYSMSGFISTMQNGALHEGYADIWAMTLNEDGVMGEGSFQINGGGFIRRYDKLPKVYPADIAGEPHNDGEIIAGAWWDLAQNMNSIDSMMLLFAEAYHSLDDGPDGTEGQVYHDILLSALTSDDDDGNITNGTPHFEAIVKAFARHGIYLYGEAQFIHDEIAHQPPGKDIKIDATLNTTQPGAGLQLAYRNRDSSSWNTIIMTPGTSGSYSARLPSQATGNIIDYYFQVQASGIAAGGIFPLSFEPATPPAFINLPYQFAVDVNARDSNDFEATATGWTIGNTAGDDAVRGVWIQSVPVGSFTPGGVISQCSTDHTTGTGKCLVTDNAATSLADVGAADVDEGTTTVLSPVFDISGFKNPIIEYYRWYGNKKGSNPGNDIWVVQMGDGNGNWRSIDSTLQSDYSWRRRIVAVKDYFGTFDKIQLKFVVSDSVVNTERNEGQSVVEAAVDDLFLYDSEPVSVKDIQETVAALYPNPADETLQIALQKAVSGSAILYDSYGRMVAELALNGKALKYAMETKFLPAGHYNLVIRTHQSVQNSKVTILHR